MKMLIIGLGSIGKRHAACLQKLGGIEIAGLRTGKGTLKEQSSYHECFGLDEALAFKPDAVIVSNPTSLHVETALPFLQAGIKALIEKPIANSSESAKNLAAYSDLFRVAYCVRFLSFVNIIKQVATKEKIFKISFKRSYYLPKWHPYADYRAEYTAIKKLGGGVIRTLSHELDLMLYLFGSPVSICGVADKLSPLEIDTDDFAFISCKMENGARINFELDFFSPKNINTAEMFTESGKYSWDMSALSFTPYHQTEPEQMYGREIFDTEEMYLSQARDFVNFVKGGESENATYSSALEVLKIIEEIDRN